MRFNRALFLRGVATRVPLVASLALGGAFALGCGGGDDKNADPSGGTTASAGALSIVFPKMYSSFDGTHTFKVPVMVVGVSGVKWTASDPNLVSIEALTDDPNTPGSQAVITVKGAGNVTITASAGNLKGTAPLAITSATPAQWDTGKARYSDGVTIRNGRMVDKAAACTNCHGTGTDDIEHTPAQTAGYSDQDLIAIFTKGQKPAGVPNRVVPKEQWTPVHQWTMTADEQAGVVVYLRSLEPQSNGTLDFGGRGAFRPMQTPPDGGMRPPRDEDAGMRGRNNDPDAGMRGNNNNRDGGASDAGVADAL